MVDQPGSKVLYSPGKGQIINEVLSPLGGVGANTASLHREWGFQIGKFGNEVNKLLTGIGAPFAWHSFTITVGCDGKLQVKFGGSFFPSHRYFIENEDQQIFLDQPNAGFENLQIKKELPAFIYAGANMPTPGQPDRKSFMK